METRANHQKPEESTHATTVRIPTPLRRVTGGQDKVNAEGETLAQIIDSMESQYPGIKERICDPDGSLRNFVNVFVNGEDVRFLDGVDSGVGDGDEVSIVPAVAGGARAGVSSRRANAKAQSRKG